MRGGGERGGKQSCHELEGGPKKIPMSSLSLQPPRNKRRESRSPREPIHADPSEN